MSTVEDSYREAEKLRPWRTSHGEPEAGIITQLARVVLTWPDRFETSTGPGATL